MKIAIIILLTITLIVVATVNVPNKPGDDLKQKSKDTAQNNNDPDKKDK